MCNPIGLKKTRDQIKLLYKSEKFKNNFYNEIKFYLF